MPVDLPQKQPIDPRLLALLGRIVGNNGSLSLSEDEYEVLEEERFFQDAAQCHLVSIDHGGEWTIGAIISITAKGRALLGEPAPESLWKRLEVVFRRRTGGPDV
jgi:hypothetical protein